MRPDLLFPGGNYDIPNLYLSLQADAVDLPVMVYGAVGRKKKAGTIVFYTDDYRFEHLWKEPDRIFVTGAVTVVEPNFSIYDDMPEAVAIYQIYRKRWLARYWQMNGVRIFVDLNVSMRYLEQNLIGVPEGWRAFATRGSDNNLDALRIELSIAQQYSNGNFLFLVYGGGKLVEWFCRDNGLLYIPYYKRDRQCFYCVQLPMFVTQEVNCG